MTTTYKGNLERDWVQLGVLFNCEPSETTPDLERLLLETARQCTLNARLLPLAATWLQSYGQFVARHRLKRLVLDELELHSQAVLGLLIETAVEHGATRDLLIVAKECQPSTEPYPLYLNKRDNDVLHDIAYRNASELSRRWGVWAPQVSLKQNAIRPVSWLLAKNPLYRERIVRKGDLRVSILETLRLDVSSNIAPSESELTRLCGATRTAVRKALGALKLECTVTVGENAPNNRDHPIELLPAA